MAIPGIGTGKHNFPEEVAFRVLREEIEFFSACVKSFCLKEIRIIVLRKQPCRSRRPLSIPAPSQSPRSPHPTSRDEYFWPTRVFFLQGDITQHPADAIINVLPENLQLSNGGGVCKSILRTGGPSIQKQLDSVGKRSPGFVVRTNAGSMKNAELILHFVPTSTDAASLQCCIAACLNQAKLLFLRSVSIPAIGTGPFGLTPRNSAEIILNAVKNFSTQYYPLDINIVVFQTNMVQEFETVIERVIRSSDSRGSSTQAQASASSAVVSPKIASFKPLNTGEPKKAVKVHVFASSAKDMTASLLEINKFVKVHTKTNEIEHEKMFNVFVEHWSEVEKLARDHDVKITCRTPSIACIEGAVTSVSDCKDELLRLINAHVEDERRTIQLKYISKNVQWYFLQGSLPVKYDKELNGQIEMALMENRDVLPFTKFGDQYEINVISKIEKNLRNGHVSRIERKCLGQSDISVPRHWDAQPQGQVVHHVPLSKSSSEYQKVFNHFVSNGGNSRKIIKIERIQNPCLYKAYLVKQQSMNGADNEMHLFHGTSSSNTPLINTNNFSRSFAGTNGVKYGNGVYFARNSSYSLVYSQLHGSLGNYQMYMARVLVGRYTAGAEGMKAPPSRNDPANPGVLYDSVVDNIHNPSIFVIFGDNQCYPEYLITFS